ncbi:MAG: carbohydrate kinase family protein, partial [FCB group bacterium]|nr:carbohydrate kinase family protein [FCB group bacterium]
FAGQFGKLGGKPFIIGAVGNDEFGKIVLEKLAALDIDISAVTIRPAVKTGLGLALVRDDDRAILTYSGSIDSIIPADLHDSILNACRHWHIASIFLMKKLRKHWGILLRYCRAHNITTSLDPNWELGS